MKNLLHQGPQDPLNARLSASVEFLDLTDIKDKEVLDIGCGYGWCVNFCLQKGVKSVTGIEISEADLTTVKEGINDRRAHFVVAGALELPFRDNSFDTVVSWEVIEHIPKGTESKMFAEVNRVLKPGGVLYLSTPHDHPFAKLLDPTWWLVGHRHYSREKLLAYAGATGFRVLDTHIKGGYWTVLGILNMYISKWIFRREPLFGDFFKIREEREYTEDTGFANIFVKARKSE